VWESTLSRIIWSCCLVVSYSWEIGAIGPSYNKQNRTEIGKLAEKKRKNLEMELMELMELENRKRKEIKKMRGTIVILTED